MKTKILLAALLLSANLSFADYIRTETLTELSMPDGRVVYRLEVIKKMGKTDGSISFEFKELLNETQNLTQAEKEALVEKSVSKSRLVKET